MTSEHLWYVAYGSNLSAARLQEYLDSCREPARPLRTRTTTIPHRLFFAHHSIRWRGGPAFVDPDVDPTAGTLATARLLDRRAFLDVLAMENGVAVGSLDGASLPQRPGARALVADGRYGLVVAVPSPDGRDAFTFTTAERPLPRATRPGPDYVDVIVSGLVADHGLAEAAARSYVAERGG